MMEHVAAIAPRRRVRRDARRVRHRHRRRVVGDGLGHSRRTDSASAFGCAAIVAGLALPYFLLRRETARFAYGCQQGCVAMLMPTRTVTSSRPDCLARSGATRGVAGDAAAELPARLGWDPPGGDDALADRWIAELDRHDVARAMLIASVPGDEASVAAAVQASSVAVRRRVHVQPGCADAEARVDTRVRRAAAAHRLSVSGDASRPRRRPADRDAIFAAAARHKAQRLRALRRAVGRRAQEARAAEPIRPAAGRSARGRGDGGAASRACR